VAEAAAEALSRFVAKQSGGGRSGGGGGDSSGDGGGGIVWGRYLWCELGAGKVKKTCRQ